MRSFAQGPVPAVALHCTLAHGGAWARLAARMSKRMTMLAPDLPGHGVLPAWEAGGDYMAACRAVLLPALDPPRHVIGHSFGAVVALAQALAAPESVRSLTLIDPVFFATATDPLLRAQVEAERVELRRRFLDEGAESAARFFTGTWGGGAPWEAQPEPVRAQIAGQIHIIGDQSPVLHFDRDGLLSKGRLEGLEVPTLVIDGGESPPVVADIARNLVSRLPDAARVTVAGAGHMLPLTHSRQVAAAIEAHFDSIPI